MRKIILLTSVVICLCTQGFAQKYGGVAYVTAKNPEGDVWVIYHARTCDFSSEEEAKANLKKTLEAKIYNKTTVFISSITYDVSKCTESKALNHGGRAVVDVKDLETGITRSIEKVADCEYMSANFDPVIAKRNFWSTMLNGLSYNEEFISPIRFYIESCNNKFKK